MVAPKSVMAAENILEAVGEPGWGEGAGPQPTAEVSEATYIHGSHPGHCADAQ
jgi:hypothetical protein